jgi:hypothetical protein
VLDSSKADLWAAPWNTSAQSVPVEVAGPTVYLSPNNDTVGESFELNIATVQEAETLTKTAKPIILAQGSVRGKWNRVYSNTA